MALARVRAGLGQRGRRERVARAGRAASGDRRARIRPGLARPRARRALAATRLPSARLAQSALDVALRAGDADLELHALAQLGLAEVSVGNVEDGLARLDEAMAAVTGGEPASLETFADVCCTLLAGVRARGRQRASGAVEPTCSSRSRGRTTTSPLLAFCRTCCADVHAASGRVDAAEQELEAALRELTEAGQRARCIHPAARLAEIRVMQGRLRRGRASSLRGFEDEPAAIDAAVALRLARGRARRRRALLERAWTSVGRENLLAAPLLARLVEARIAEERRASSARAAAGAARADRRDAGRDRVVAAAVLARGRIAPRPATRTPQTLLRAGGEPVRGARASGSTLPAPGSSSPAPSSHRPPRTLSTWRDARSPSSSRSARCAKRTRPRRCCARSASKGRAGPRSGRAAHAGARSRCCGSSARASRTRRSRQRLFISPKTAEHHVGRIYAKLGVEHAREVAAYAVRNLGERIGGFPLPRPPAPRDAAAHRRKEARDVRAEQGSSSGATTTQVLNGRDLDAVGDYFADERDRRGRHGAAASSYFEAFPDLHVSVDELIAEDDRVFVRSTMTGTHDGEYKGIPATGRHVAAECGRGVPDRGRQVRRLLVPARTSPG